LRDLFAPFCEVASSERSAIKTPIWSSTCGIRAEGFQKFRIFNPT
jgi:hypothetical protein